MERESFSQRTIYKTMICYAIQMICCCCVANVYYTGHKYITSIKLCYLLLLYFFLGMLLLFSFVGDTLLGFFSKFIGCPNNDDLSVCMGVSMVVR